MAKKEQNESTLITVDVWNKKFRSSSDDFVDQYTDQFTKIRTGALDEPTHYNSSFH